MHFTIPGAYIQEISEHQASLSLTQALIDCPGITSSPGRFLLTKQKFKIELDLNRQE
jgi:hypothetical protein